MKIIDVNLTLGGRDSVGKEMDLAYLLDLMADYRIDHGVCYHQHALLDPKDGNSKMAALAAQAGGKLSVCAVLDPILYEGKFEEPGREGKVTVEGNLAFTDVQVINEDCSNRTPAYFLFRKK